MDALRARSRERRVFERNGEDDRVAETRAAGALPEHLAHVRRQLVQLEGALSSLSPDKASVVYLHDVLGYELSEIAVLVGTSVAAAQSRLVRGRRDLASCMHAGGSFGRGRLRQGSSRARGNSEL